MSEQTPATGTQQSGPQPRQATTSELIGAAHQLSQMVAAQVGTSTPSPAPATAQQR